MKSYDGTIELVQQEVYKAIERIKLQLGSDLSKHGIVDTTELSKHIVDKLSWSYGSTGRR